jgi:intracellular septation protein A
MKTKHKNFHVKVFDVVRIKKIHANKIFDHLEKGEKQLNFNNDEFIKVRPAIVIQKIGSILIVLPLTSKPIINDHTKAHQLLRTEFIHKSFSQPSYLMFDSLLRIQENQIEGLYKQGKILFTESTKK